MLCKLSQWQCKRIYTLFFENGSKLVFITGNFNNETKNILREIIGEADNAQKALNELDKAEMELARKSDDELAQIEQRATNGKDLREKIII